jgi:hypothetical protein
MNTTTDTNTIRVRAFLDFWNLQISLREYGARRQARRPELDWSLLGPWLTERSADLLAPVGERPAIVHAGLHVYISHNRLSPADQGLRRFARALTYIPGGVDGARSCVIPHE